MTSPEIDAVVDTKGVVMKNGWCSIETAPRDGTPFCGRARNGAGYWMYPWTYRHEGKLYSGFQEFVDGQWRNSAGADPEVWLPASIEVPE